MTHRSGPLPSRDVARALLLALAALVVAWPGVTTALASGPEAGSSPDAIAVSPADWARASALAPSLTRQQTDPAPRNITFTAFAVASGVLTLMVLRRALSASPVVRAFEQGRPSECRSCRAPPLPRLA